MNIKNNLQSIRRYLQSIIRYRELIVLKYDIKREYFTIGIPVFIALMLFIGALVTGHTFPGHEPREIVDAEADEALARLEEIRRLAELEGEELLTDGGDVLSPLQKEEPIGKSNLDHILIFAFLIAITPFTIDSYLQKKKVRKQELAYTEFLFKLSELMRGGIDPVKSTISLSSTHLGPITNEIQQTSADMSLGTSFADSMMHMAGRIKSRIIQKYTALVVEAAHMGGNVAEIVFRSSEDMRNVIKINEEKERNLKQYVLIFYFAQAVLLLIAYILTIQLIPQMQGIDPKYLPGAAEIAAINFNLIFFHMIMINALFGGLIIGQIVGGDIRNGLKHVVILMVACYLISVHFILPIPIAAQDQIIVQVLSGADQIATTGVPLSMPIVFRVVDGEDNPREGVEFNISISPHGNVTPNATSGPDGAFNIAVTPGIEEGIHIIEIRHEEILKESIPIEVRSIIRVEPVSGYDQIGITGMPLNEEIRFIVKDYEGNPIRTGIRVRAAISHNGNVTLRSPITDESGIFAFNAIMGTSYGTHRITVQVAGWKHVHVDIPVEFPTRPIISEPIDLTLDQHSKGEISWNIMDNNPDKLSVVRNGVYVLLPTQLIGWDNIEDISHSVLTFIGLPSLKQESITIPIDTSTVGTWNYTIIVRDTEGNITTDEVIVEIIDVTSPIISQPSDQHINQNETAYINWTITEENPANFIITRNNGIIRSAASFYNNEIVRQRINTNIPGNFVYRIVVFDVAGNTAMDDVVITITDVTPPIISRPFDQRINQNETAYINWTITEENPANFIITRNNEIISPAAPFYNNENFKIQINTSISGNFVYRITAFDAAGNKAIDEVIVEIIDGGIPPIISQPFDQHINRNETAYIN